MQVSVLFSGGKDSSLAAIMLEPFFDVELVTCTFSLLPVGDFAQKTAKELGFAHRVVCLDISILEDAYEMIIKDGFPKNAINHIHRSAVEYLASEKKTDFIADGVRRDDRVPLIDQSQARSIEDRHGVHYLCPLKGFGRAAVNELVKKHLVIEEGPSEQIIKSDYEAELRELIKQRNGLDLIGKLFPSHIQSHVIERKRIISIS
jgi:predicted subunit of tRNA(5-methylaminomethyl-2-thiouridylate) methyltransferase